MSLEKLKKSELIEEYRALERELEDLKLDYDNICEEHHEAENRASELQDRVDELECMPYELKCDAISQLLNNLVWNNELWEKLYSIIRKRIVDRLSVLYYQPENKIDKKLDFDTTEEIHRIVEDYLNNFLEFDLK